jgi:hypothetical protein
MTEEVEKDMKGPESPGIKRPGKIPLSANRTAIQEVPADRSSTSQNYKNTPDMPKSEDRIDKSDEVALKKSVTEATTLMKAMRISVERL